MVADAVEGGVVPVTGQPVEPRPRGRRCPLRVPEATVRGEDEDLRPGRRGVGGRDDDLDVTVTFEVGRCHAADLGALTSAAGRSGPAVLQAQPTADEVVCRDSALVAADDDLGDLVPVEVGDDAGCVHAAFRGRALREQMPPRVEDERRVERRDDLELPVAVQVDEAGGREPAGLTGGDVAQKRGRLHARCPSGGSAAGHGGSLRVRRACEGQRQPGEQHRGGGGARHEAWDRSPRWCRSLPVSRREARRLRPRSRCASASRAQPRRRPDPGPAAEAARCPRTRVRRR